MTSLRARLRQRGAALAETVVVLPVLLLLGLGALQWALVYEAKSALGYATFMGARAGALDHANPQAIRIGFARGIAPLYSPEPNAAGQLQAMAQVGADILAQQVHFAILNPTREAFTDFGQDLNEDGRAEEIPNHDLGYLETTRGGASGVNLQDANLLKLEVLYGHRLKVPFVGPLTAEIGEALTRDPVKLRMLRAGRLPLLASATVRMQTDAHQNPWVLSRADVTRAVVTGSTPETDPSAGSGDGGSPGGNPDGTPSGGGSGGASDGGAPGGGLGDGDPGNNLTPGSGGGQDEAPPPECEKPTLEEDDAGAKQEDRGIWGDLWNTVKDGITFGYEFIKGFWEGIKEQVGDLVELITDPVETAKGLIELAKAFYEDFEGTAKAIGEALGQEFTQLTECGAFDKGKVIGSYASPAFMFKLATRLAKFGKLTTGRVAAVIRQIRKDFPCASFAAGTSVWTPQGKSAIETLRRGQSVHSRNDQEFSDQPQVITKILGRTAPHYRVLVTERETLKVTEEHPLWVQGKGWTPIRDIERGDALATVDGDELVLQNTRVTIPLKVHNFSVANTPSYFVGENQIWAHNANIVCAKGNLVHSSTRLKNNLNKAGFDIPDGYAAHHVIPGAVAKDSDALKYAAKHLGYDIDNFHNGLALPTDPKAAMQVSLPVHNGRHTNEYNDYVRDKLTELDRWWETGGDDVTEAALFERIANIENDVKVDLRNCNIFCQKPPNQP